MRSLRSKRAWSRLTAPDLPDGAGGKGLVNFAFCLLPSAFCLLPSAFCGARRSEARRRRLRSRVGERSEPVDVGKRERFGIDAVPLPCRRRSIRKDVTEM